MKKRFGIDIDGTVTRPDSIVPYMNQAFNLNLTLDDITQYDLSGFVDVSQEEFANWWLQNEELIYVKSPLSEGVKNVLNKWDVQHELYFISARRSHLLEITKEWFQSQGLSFHHIELIGSHNKVETAKNYDVDIFFEDKHDNAVMIHESCGIPVLLFNTPYNQDPIPNGVIRVNNWLEAETWVSNWLG